MSRRKWRSLAYLVVLVLIYLLAAFAYASSIRSDDAQLLPPVEHGANVKIDIVSIDPAAEKAVVRIRLEPIGQEWKSKTKLFGFSRPIRMYVPEQITGTSVYDFKPDQPVGVVEVVVHVNGNAATYPLDRYSYGLHDQPYPLIIVGATDPTGKEAVPVPLGMTTPPDHLQNWRQSWVFSKMFVLEGADTGKDGGILAVDLEMSRAGLTLAFAFVVFGLMLTMAALAIMVAFSVAYRRRKIEATMASWFAAMLFALIPLRAFLPGAPPLGVWMDVLVFFWVELALLAAMAIFIGSWLSFGPYAERRAGDTDLAEPGGSVEANEPVEQK